MSKEVTKEKCCDEISSKCCEDTNCCSCCSPKDISLLLRHVADFFDKKN